jgi:hypothetical protein
MVMTGLSIQRIDMNFEELTLDFKVERMKRDIGNNVVIKLGQYEGREGKVHDLINLNHDIEYLVDIGEKIVSIPSYNLFFKNKEFKVKSSEEKTMNEVNCFKTKDGRIFEDKLEAEKHDKFIRFHENYIGDPILDSRGNPVVSENIYHFLSENFGWVEKLFTSGNNEEQKSNQDLVFVHKKIILDEVIENKKTVYFKNNPVILSLTNRGTLKIESALESK